MSDIVEELREYAVGSSLPVERELIEKTVAEITRLRAENEKLDDTRIDYICKINKLVDEREALKKALRAILNDAGYHNPMRMTTEISDKILEDAAGALNDNI